MILLLTIPLFLTLTLSISPSTYTKNNGVLLAVNDTNKNQVGYTTGTIGIEWEIPFFRLHEPLVLNKENAISWKKPSYIQKPKNTKIWTGAGGGYLQVEIQGQNKRGFEFVTPPVAMTVDGRAKFIAMVTDLATKATELMIPVRNAMIEEPLVYKYALCAKDGYKAEKDVDVTGGHDPKTCEELKNYLSGDRINAYIGCHHLRYPLLIKDLHGELQFDNEVANLCSYRPPWTGIKRNGENRHYAVTDARANYQYWNQAPFWELLPEEQIIGSLQVSVAFDPSFAGFQLWESAVFQTDYVQFNTYLTFTPALVKRIKALMTIQMVSPKSYWRRRGAPALIGWVSYYAWQFRKSELGSIPNPNWDGKDPDKKTKHVCQLFGIKDSVLGFNVRTNLVEFYNWVNTDYEDSITYDKLPTGDAWWALIKLLAYSDENGPCDTDKCGFTDPCTKPEDLKLGGDEHGETQYTMVGAIKGISQGKNDLHDIEPALSSLPLTASVAGLQEQTTIVIEFRITAPNCLYTEKNFRGTPNAGNVVQMAGRWYDVFSSLVKGQDQDKDWVATWKGDNNRCETAEYSMLLKDDQQKPKQWVMVGPKH